MEINGRTVLIGALVAVLVIWLGVKMWRASVPAERISAAEAPRRRVSPTPCTIAERCAQLGRKLESEDIDLSHTVLTGNHCHIRVDDPDDVLRGRDLLCEMSQGTLADARKSGLASLSIFSIYDDSDPLNNHV